jgi:hypothetical protein
MTDPLPRAPPDDIALGHALWVASTCVLPAVAAAIDNNGDDIPIATFLILADVLKAEGWRADQLIDGVRYVFEHDLFADGRPIIAPIRLVASP